jgi:hypothetical protein
MALFNKKTTDSLDASLDVIAKADALAFGGVGFAGSLLPATQAYFSIEEAMGSQPGRKVTLRPRLERMLDSATPAGRIYAAELLNHVEAAVGQAAWRRLAKQDAEVRTFTGCIMGKTTVRRYANDRLSSG